MSLRPWTSKYGDYVKCVEPASEDGYLVNENAAQHALFVSDLR